jgi:hypothetical protein
VRLNPTVLRIASVHFVVDGYGNILAPLLPLLLVRLDFTLATAGLLMMLFQLSASVSQVGFGQLALDVLAHPRRIRPRRVAARAGVGLATRGGTARPRP